MSGQAAIRLPDEVNLLKLINARKEEINSINSECRTKLPKLAQQRLPRYMRRRAASHNPKRIPKACRSKWLTSTKAPTGHSDATSEVKEKRRLKMKKHINEKKLKENIEKRNAREERSLFHVWFAKRFKMEPLWSKLVPIRNNTKNERNLHRMAKRGICYYYMSSFMKALTIRIGFNEMQLFLHQLISPESKSLIENVEDHEQIVNLYEPEKYPLGLIGPVALSWSSSKCEWTVWCHVSILESVTQLLTDRFSSETLSVDVADLERIKLVGPESFEKLEKVLEQKVSFSTEDNGILFNVDVSKISELEPLCDPTSCHFQVVNDNIGDRISLDIVVEKKCARAIWNKLIVNKSHLVGGIRDLKTLYFNSSKPLFPYFGFSDAKISHEIVVHNSPWISQYLDSKKDAHITRTACDAVPQSLIRVQIDAISRGTPEKGDIVCLPTREDLAEFHKIEEFPLEKYSPVELSGRKVAKNVHDSCRTVIGCVEFGAFDLSSGHGKGIGFVDAVKLHTLKALPTELGLDGSKIIALHRPWNSSKFRFVELTVL